MLGLPELDRMICLELSLHDLAHCTRVNKEWHNATIPYLWRDLSCLERCSDTAASAFRRLVAIDYLHEQRKRILYDNRQGMGQRIKTRWYRSLETQATLSKYCPWIRELPHPRRLLDLFQPPLGANRLPQKPSGFGNGPPAQELLRHLYRHCSAMRIDTLVLQDEDIGMGLLKIIGEFVIPIARSIRLVFFFPANPENVKYVLDHCSCKLEELSMIVNMSAAGGNVDWEQEPEGSKAWSNLKQLDLYCCADMSASKRFWPWLWKRCGQVEKLTIGMVKGIANSLGEGMLSHMPNLNQIEIGRRHIPFDATDDQLAAILLGARKGWKAMGIGGSFGFRESLITILSRHLTTLEILMIGQSNEAMIRLVSRCPMLDSLFFADDQRYLGSSYSGFKAETFVDRDSHTGTLKPWLCEGSLQRLVLHITGIPRPDLLENAASHETVVEESYPGQGREIQSQVYDRIARFTKLKLMILGDPEPPMPCDCHAPVIYSDCLEMSIESGLPKLAELKALRILDVSGLKTRIGVKELQWMVEHWPNLSHIARLKGSGFSVEAENLLERASSMLEIRRD